MTFLFMYQSEGFPSLGAFGEN